MILRAGKTELSTTTGSAAILADPAKAMVDMIFLCSVGFGYLSVNVETQSSILLSGGGGR